MDMTTASPPLRREIRALGVLVLKITDTTPPISVLLSMPMKRIWDISPPVHAGSPVFPGDTPYGQQWVARISSDCPVNVSAITFSPHTGANADAPLHYDPSGAAIGELDLHPYLGPCRVIHAMGCGPWVLPEHLASAQAGLPPRVLVRLYERLSLIHI